MAVTVDIFGESYTIKGNENEDYIKKLADYVNKKMVEISNKFGSMSQTKVAILAALNIADDLFQIKEQGLELENIMKEKFEQLIKKLEEELTKSYTIVS